MVAPLTPAEEAVSSFAAQPGRLPEEVVAQARRCLLDLVGVAAGGFATPQASIVRATVADTSLPCQIGAPLWFDGRRVALPGAAWANATAIESLDGHDGHSLTKGHAGVAVLPAVMAVSAAGEGAPPTGEALLRSIVVGYELCLRAGLALHATAADYHSSGSWNAVGGAVVAAQALGCPAEALLHAAGIAEYFGPRGPMMRCIEHPSMVKDSSGWGARVAVDAALLARGGFTGRPAGVFSHEAESLWLDLGRRWRILEQYFKPFPICRWAQPAVEGVLALLRDYSIESGDVTGVEVASFREAVALSTRQPRDTEEAQYSLPFAVAAAVARGRLGAAEIMNDGLDDAETRRLAGVVRLREVEQYSRRFPGERVADVILELRDGRRLERIGATSRGDPDSPLSAETLAAKYHGLADDLLGRERADAIEDEIGTLGRTESSRLPALLAAPTSPVGS